MTSVKKTWHEKPETLTGVEHAQLVSGLGVL